MIMLHIDKLTLANRKVSELFCFLVPSGMQNFNAGLQFSHMNTILLYKSWQYVKSGY